MMSLPPTGASKNKPWFSLQIWDGKELGGWKVKVTDEDPKNTGSIQTGRDDAHPGKPAEAGLSRHCPGGGRGLVAWGRGGSPAHGGAPASSEEQHTQPALRFPSPSHQHLWVLLCLGSGRGTSVSVTSERTRPHKRTALRSSSASYTLNPLYHPAVGPTVLGRPHTPRA